MSFDVEEEATLLLKRFYYPYSGGGISATLIYVSSREMNRRRQELRDLLTRAIESTEEERNKAYNERNRLVAYLASVYPSCLERHPEEEEWENDWRWIVFIHHPSGQLSWHIHDSELPLFDHVPRGMGNVKWDGHTTEEKYQRLATAIHERRHRWEKRGG